MVSLIKKEKAASTYDIHCTVSTHTQSTIALHNCDKMSL